MEDNEERYCDKVVDMIMKHDIEYNVLVKKGSNRFIVADYYVTRLLGYSFSDPMAFFRGANWYIIGLVIGRKYGISTKGGLKYIKEIMKERMSTMMNTYIDEG